MKKPLKVTWKRAGKRSRLAAIGEPNECRSHYAYVKKERIGYIHNSSASSLYSDGKLEWSVTYFGAPTNVTLKRRFAFADIEEAKTFFTEWLNGLLSTSDLPEQHAAAKTRILSRHPFLGE